MTADAVGGVWTYSMELAQALAGYGVSIGLATMGPPLSRDQRKEAHRIPMLELFESAFNLEWMRDPWHDVDRAGEWLLGVEARLKPDVVHLNGYAHAALPWDAPVVTVGHSCVLSWWKGVKGCGVPASWNRYRDAVRRGLAASRLVIAPTHTMLEALKEHYPGAVRNARVIPNGRDAALFRPRPKGRFVFSAGRVWDEAKNIAAVEKAAAKLAWPVYVAGDRGPEPRQAAAGVRVLGRLGLSDLAHFYGRAPIYALPARYEPFGLSVLEAAMSGCALVLGDIPSLRENWAGAAIFVPPEDTEALQSALKTLISDARLRAGLRMEARLRARRFAPQRMAEAYISAYRDACAADRENIACA